MAGAVVLILGPEFDGKVVAGTQPPPGGQQQDSQQPGSNDVSTVNGADTSCSS